MTNKIQSKKTFKPISFIIALLMPLTLGLIVSLLIPNMKPLYENLEKPFWALPSIVFPITWTILYILMGTASYKVYMKYNFYLIYYGHLYFLVSDFMD